MYCIVLYLSIQFLHCIAAIVINAIFFAQQTNGKSVPRPAISIYLQLCFKLTLLITYFTSSRVRSSIKSAFICCQRWSFPS